MPRLIPLMLPFQTVMRVPSKVSPPQVAPRAVYLDSQRDERTNNHSNLLGKASPAGGRDTTMADKLVTHRIGQKSVATAKKLVDCLSRQQHVHKKWKTGTGCRRRL